MGVGGGGGGAVAGRLEGGPTSGSSEKSAELTFATQAPLAPLFRYPAPPFRNTCRGMCGLYGY